MSLKVRFPGHHFANRTLSKAAEVKEELSRATERIFSRGVLLTSRMERTAHREAIATLGRIERLGIVAGV